MTFSELILLPFRPAIKKYRVWRAKQIELHCTRCAEFEKQRAREAWANASYYQLRAIQARNDQRTTRKGT